MNVHFAVLAMAFWASVLLPTKIVAMEHRSQLSLGADTHSQTLALAWNPSWSCCGVSWFRFGTGLRFSAFHGRDLILETAEYELIDGNQTSSLTNADAKIYAFNAIISADVQALDWLIFGFNLDLVGVSLGPDQTVSYGEVGFDPTPNIHPTPLNLFR